MANVNTWTVPHGDHAWLNERGGGHVIQLLDMRERYGDEEACAADCECGWRGARHEGRLARDAAWRDGMRHLEQTQRERAAVERDVR
jgi:hypothetical protein